jgi:hypothetical protein
VPRRIQRDVHPQAVQRPSTRRLRPFIRCTGLDTRHRLIRQNATELAKSRRASRRWEVRTGQMGSRFPLGFTDASLAALSGFALRTRTFGGQPWYRSAGGPSEVSLPARTSAWDRPAARKVSSAAACMANAGTRNRPLLAFRTNVVKMRGERRIAAVSKTSASHGFLAL